MVTEEQLSKAIATLRRVAAEEKMQKKLIKAMEEEKKEKEKAERAARKMSTSPRPNGFLRRLSRSRAQARTQEDRPDPKKELKILVSGYEGHEDHDESDFQFGFGFDIKPYAQIFYSDLHTSITGSPPPPTSTHSLQEFTFRLDSSSPTDIHILLQRRYTAKKLMWMLQAWDPDVVLFVANTSDEAALGESLVLFEYLLNGGCEGTPGVVLVLGGEAEAESRAVVERFEQFNRKGLEIWPIVVREVNDVFLEKFGGVVRNFIGERTDSLSQGSIRTSSRSSGSKSTLSI